MVISADKLHVTCTRIKMQWPECTAQQAGMLVLHQRTEDVTILFPTFTSSGCYWCCFRYYHCHNKSGGMQAYRLACHYGDTEEQVHETMKISSSAVFNKLMLFVLKEGHHIFLRMLSLDELTTVTARDVQRSKRMKKVEGLLKSFLGNSLHLLGERRL